MDAVAGVQERGGQHRVPASVIPNPPTFDNFVDVFTKHGFLTYTINSVIVSFSVIGLALLLGVPAGYRIAKAKASKAAVLILITPDGAGSVVSDPIISAVSMVWPDRCAGAAGDHAFGHHDTDRGLWIMIGVFEGLPGELEEVALLDGATMWQAFRHVAMPLARPGITVTMTLSRAFSVGTTLSSASSGRPFDPHFASCYL